MANIKITDLTAYADPASTDVLPIVDVGADVTKKVSVADLLENAGSGTESAPGIAFDGDSNTGIYRPGADQVAISTGGAQRLLIDSDGDINIDGGSVSYDATNNRLGIGTTSPGVALHVNGDIRCDGVYGETDTNTSIRFTGSDVITFNEGGSEAARFDSSGRLLVGTSTEISSGDVASFVSSNSVSISLRSDFLANSQGVFFNTESPDGQRFAQMGLLVVNNANPAGFLRLAEEDGLAQFFWVDNSGNFRISTTSSHVGTTNGTVVGTQTSDKRLKNVGDLIGYGLNEVLQLQPKKYALKEKPDTNKLGFIAQEVESIIPEAVFDTGEELEGHQEGDRTKLGMEYVQLIPVLVNAIKQQQAIITDLQTRLSALEAP